MSVDDNLLGGAVGGDLSLNNQNGAEDSINQEDEGQEGGSNDDDNNNDDGADAGPAPQSLREARIMEIARARKDEISGGQGAESKKAAESKAASKILTTCFSLKTLSASWGSSALYGNVHLFLKYTVNDKLRSLSFRESMILALVDFVLALLIIIQISIIALIAGFLDNPLKAIKDILESVFKNWLKI